MNFQELLEKFQSGHRCFATFHERRGQYSLLPREIVWVQNYDDARLGKFDGVWIEGYLEGFYDKILYKFEALTNIADIEIIEMAKANKMVATEVEVDERIAKIVGFVNLEAHNEYKEIKYSDDPLNTLIRELVNYKQKVLKDHQYLEAEIASLKYRLGKAEDPHRNYY